MVQYIDIVTKRKKMCDTQRESSSAIIKWTHQNSGWSMVIIPFSSRLF